MWYVFLWFNIAVLYLVMPLNQIYLCLPKQFSSENLYYTIFGMCYLLYIFVLWVCGSFGASYSESLSPLENIISRIGFIGIVLVACLSGLATSHIILTFFGIQLKNYNPDTIKNKEKRLAVLSEEIAELKDTISSAPLDASQSSGGISGLMFRLGSTFRLSGNDHLVVELSEKELELINLRKELDGLIVEQVLF